MRRYLKWYLNRYLKQYLKRHLKRKLKGSDIVIAAKPIDIRAKLKDYMDIAFNGEPVIVSRKENRNVVIVSEKEYNELQKARRNAEYLKNLDRSFSQLERGETISLSLEELRLMESEDWKPSQKIINFVEKMKNE